MGKRTAWVIYKNTNSEKREFKLGVPQGSPISPFLFNIYCAAALLVDGCGQGVGMQADDMCVWRTHKQEREACKELTNDLQTVPSWAESHNMQFSTKECKVLRITNRKTKKLEKYPIILFGGQVWPRSKLSSLVFVDICSFGNKVEAGPKSRCTHGRTEILA